MRRLFLLIALGISVGVIAGAVAVRAESVLDARYRIAGWERQPPVWERFADPDRGPVLFVPASVTGPDAPAPTALVLALPGLGGIGRPLADGLSDAAESHRWLVLAPSPIYERQDESFSVADLRVDDEILQLLDLVRRTAPRPTAQRIFVVGFSRGAQTAHRFALRHPDLVAAVASLSAGSYTMPNSELDYPLGVGHFATFNGGHVFDPVALRSVRFLIGVGDADTSLAAVPADWNAVGGTTRVERAQRFAGALRTLAVPVRLEIFPGVGHVLTPDMLTSAEEWFAVTP